MVYCELFPVSFENLVLTTLFRPSVKATLADKQNLLSWWLNTAKSHTPEEAVAARLFLIVSKQ